MTPGRRLDLHVHSAHSPDGRAPVEALVAAAQQAGLDGLALADHQSVDGLGRLADLARETPGFLWLPAVEVSTDAGHLLAFGLGEVPPRDLPVDAAVAWVEGHGGVPVLAHPFRLVHGVGTRWADRAAVPAIETINGHTGLGTNRRATEVARRRGLGTTGGSDAHGVEEVGTAWTRFPEAAATVDDLLEALRRGRTVAEGRSATASYRLRLAARSLRLRLRRGLRPI